MPGGHAGHKGHSFLQLHISSLLIVFTFSSAPCHFTFTVSFTFRVFHRYLVGMQATRATVSFNFTSLIPFSVWQSMQLLSFPL